MNEISMTKDSLTLNINLTIRNLVIGIMLWLYLYTFNASKGFFFSDQGVMGVLGSLLEYGMSSVMSIPMIIIDLMPIIFTTLLIVLHTLDKPIKKIFFSGFIFYFIPHLYYILLAVVGFELSMALFFSYIFLLILFLYLLITNETKRDNSKVIFQRKIQIKVAKYNLLMVGFLIFLTILLLFTPFIGLSKEASKITSVVESVGKYNTETSALSSSFNDSTDTALSLINLPTLILKIPFIIVSLVSIIKVFKNKDQVFTIPLAVVFIGILTFLGLPLIIEKLNLDEMLSVSSAIKNIGYLLMIWVLFEMYFVREINQKIKTLGTTAVGNFNTIARDSRFSQKTILVAFTRIPFIGKKINRVLSGENIETTKSHARKSQRPTGQNEDVLFERKSGTFKESTSIMVDGLKLTKDQTLSLWVCLKNLGNEPINAIIVSVELMDVVGRKLYQEENVQLLDLGLSNLSTSSWIKLPLEIIHENARNIEIILTHLVLENGQITNYSNDNRLTYNPGSTSNEIVSEPNDFEYTEPENANLPANEPQEEPKIKGEKRKATMTWINNLTSGIVNHIKGKPKQTGIIVSVLLILILSYTGIEYIGSQPLTEDAAVDLYLKYAKAAKSTVLEQDLRGRDLEIGYVLEKDAYSISRYVEVEFQRNALGFWKVDGDSIVYELVEPRTRPDFKRDENAIKNRGAELVYGSIEDIVVDFPESSDVLQNNTFVFPLTFRAQGDLGQYQGTILVSYDFEDYEWHFEGAELDPSNTTFTPSSQLIAMTEVDQVIENLNFDKLWINDQVYTPDQIEIKPLSSPTPSWNYDRLDVPVLLIMTLDGDVYESESTLALKYENEVGYVIDESSLNHQVDLVRLPIVGKVNLLDFKEGYDYAIGETFKTFETNKEFVFALRGNMERQDFDDYGNVIGDRRMGDLAIFDVDGKLITLNPPLVAFDVNGNLGLMDFMYNDYEYGINLYRDTDIIKTVEDGKTFLIVMDAYYWSGTESISIVKYTFSEDLSLVPVSQYEGTRVIEGGYETKSEANLNGKIGTFDDLNALYGKILNTESDFHILKHSAPDYGGFTFIQPQTYQ